MFQQFGGGVPSRYGLNLYFAGRNVFGAGRDACKAGALVAEMISQYELTAEPAKVRERIEEIASTYQDPEEVINWYYSDNEQLAGIESRVLEDAVVDKVVDEASVTTKSTELPRRASHVRAGRLQIRQIDKETVWQHDFIARRKTSAWCRW